jgi:hypothetical protein
MHKVIRGYEHGAEILRWAIGEVSSHPTDNDSRSIAEAFELLTGLPTPSFVG